MGFNGNGKSYSSGGSGYGANRTGGKPSYNGGRQSVPQPELPSGYLNGGYFSGTDDDKSLKTLYVLDFAKSISDGLASRKMAKSQLRKFYEFVVNTNDDLARNKISVSEAITEISRLDSLACQAVTKGKAPELFGKFISKNIKELKTQSDINAFKKHFEAIVSYYPEIK